MRVWRRSRSIGPRSATWPAGCAGWCSAAAALVALSSPAARSEENVPYVVRTVSAARTNGPISIDGRLDEPFWMAAEVGSAFIQTEPDDGAPATVETRFRVL